MLGFGPISFSAIANIWNKIFSENAITPARRRIVLSLNVTRMVALDTNIRTILLDPNNSRILQLESQVSRSLVLSTINNKRVELPISQSRAVILDS